MKAKQFYDSVYSLMLIDTCEGSGIRKWEDYMKGTKKADATKVERLIKTYLPELYHNLALQYYNPFRCQTKRKKGLIVYVHSSIEYFIKINQ